MRVTLPNPLLLFYDHALPHLSRRASTSEPPPSPPAGPAAASASQGAAASLFGAAAARSASARSLASPSASSAAASPDASPAVAGAAAAEAPQPSGGPAPAGLQPAGSGRLGRLLLRMHLRRQPPRPKLLRQQQTVPVDEVSSACTACKGALGACVIPLCEARSPGWLTACFWAHSQPVALLHNSSASPLVSPPSTYPRPAAAAAGGAAHNPPSHLSSPLPPPSPQLLQPVVLQNKAPHWNEGLRCWCLNFRGRVKLASVKNFQVRPWL